MLDPTGFINGYLANLANELTMGVIKALTRKAKQQFESPPHRQALVRCYQAGSVALLPPDDPTRETMQPILQRFFAQAGVQKELSVLARGRGLDQEVLVDLFEAFTEGTPRPDFDFEARLADFTEAFLQAAAREEALVEVIKIDQLRRANASLLAMVGDLAAIRRAVERVSPSSGSVSAARDITATNIVTGVQHIVTIYQAGDGQWSAADYRAALERYLDWLREAMGRVVLRGIKRGGQQAVELALADVYVPLAAEALPEAREQLKRGLKAGARPAVESAELMPIAAQAEQIRMPQLLAQGRRLAVIGAPGCGKTTVLQHIAWTLAEALRTGQPDLAADRLGLTEALPLPVYVPLNLYADHRRRFADHPDPHQRQLATFISHYLIERQAGLNLPVDFFATLLNQGRHVILLLDGLDEVPSEAERALVSQAVGDLTCGRPQARVVVTSRTRAYQGKAVLGADFRVIRVLPLEPEQVADLIQRAYRAIYPAAVEQTDRERQAHNLIDSVAKLEAERAARLGGVEENRLVTTPLLVRMLLIVHFNLRRLPDQRAELYMEVVDTLLTSAHNPDEVVAQRLEQLGGDWRNRREMLQYLAYQMHSRGQQAGREIDERELTGLLCTYLVKRRHKPPQAAETLVADFISVSRQRGSLLEERAGRHRFSHLSFQEFLVARYLAEVERDVGRIVAFIEAENRAADAWWREPILLAVGYLNVATAGTAASLVHGLAHLASGGPPRTGLALSAAELAATAFLEWGGADTTRQALAKRLVDLLTDPALAGATPPLRAAAGRVLARLGDPRRGVGLLPEAKTGDEILPDLAWCQIPGGPFLLGANEDETGAYDDEKPQHELTLPTFYIARYPITNAQFAPFIEAGGYEERQWWTEAGWAWRTGTAPEPDLSFITDKDTRKQYADWLAQRPAERRHEPFFWQEERFNLPNQPVVGVTWYEAMAYCAWLGKQLAVSRQPLTVSGPPSAAGGQDIVDWLASGAWQVRLPAEAEWEKAAGWEPETGRKRVYAWGDEWDETKANVAEKVGRTSAVGVFPAGASACGALDMTGNVWEWTLSSWGSFDWNEPGFRYPFAEARPQTGTGAREGVDTPGFRVLRGGAWAFYEGSARVSARDNSDPVNFYYGSGCRVVVAPVP